MRVWPYQGLSHTEERWSRPASRLLTAYEVHGTLAPIVLDLKANPLFKLKNENKFVSTDSLATLYVSWHLPSTYEIDF